MLLCLRKYGSFVQAKKRKLWWWMSIWLSFSSQKGVDMQTIWRRTCGSFGKKVLFGGSHQFGPERLRIVTVMKRCMRVSQFLWQRTHQLGADASHGTFLIKMFVVSIHPWLVTHRKNLTFFGDSVYPDICIKILLKVIAMKR